ncbi:hypothetical protein PENTCL1PPCAC_16298, partial [Pristionchus entomophagus]
LFQIAISLFSMHGFLLCTFIGIMNYGHVFREGTFIIVGISPLVSFLPKSLSLMITRIVMVLSPMIWTLIPAMSTLQLLTLSRKFHWSVSKQLLISFLFPCFCSTIVATTVEELVPSVSFEKILIRITGEVYEMDGDFITVGGTMRYPQLNHDRTLVFFAVFYAIVPYAFTYAALGILMYQIRNRLSLGGAEISERTKTMQRAFFVMQLLQSVLPLVILSSPFSVFLYGVFTQSDLGLSALWFTCFLWVCPSVQAIVQLRYVRQAAKNKSAQPTIRLVSL